MNSRHTTLPNGRTVGFDDLGSRDGEALLFFHGTPASRINFSFFLAEELIRDRRLRVICPDRPGIGGSSPHPIRTPRDLAEDMGLLLDDLGLERVTLLAHSGGGPYALCCAAFMPERVKAVGLVAGSPLSYSPNGRSQGGSHGPGSHGPGSQDRGSKNRGSQDRSSQDRGDKVEGQDADSERFLELCARRPAIARGVLRLMKFASLVAPALFVRQAASALPPSDREVMCDPQVRQIFLEMIHEALRQGPGGTQQDAAIIYGPWRLPLQELRAPVRLWYGMEDRNVAPHVGESFRKRIRGSELSLLPGEGHLSIMVRHGRAIIESLLERD